MKLGIYAQALSSLHLTGIGHFVLDLIEAVAEISSCHEHYLFSSLPIQHVPRGNNITCFQKKPKLAFSYLGFPLAIKEKKCDIAFFPRQGGSPLINKPQIIYIHDLYVFEKSLHFHLMHKLFFTKATLVLTNSFDTKNDIVKKCGVNPEKVVVLYPGYNPSVWKCPTKEKINIVLNKYRITTPFFLNPSSLWWARKNLLRLIEAFENFCKKTKENYQLIITGQSGIGNRFHKSDYGDMIQLITEKNLEKKVKLLQYVPQEDLCALYASAEALVFPSLHEGFGIPLIEAMAVGCPVITSDTSALPEVTGDAGLLVNPFSIKSIEEGMTKIIDDGKIRERLIRNGFQRAELFTRKKMATSFLKIIEEVEKKL